MPEQPTFQSRAEKQVWLALRRTLPDDALLMANLHFTGHDGDWEVDILVGLPGSGFATIEVKGGKVWHADGAWWQATPDGVKSIDLEAQSISEKYLSRRYLERHPAWRYGQLRIIHMVALPGSVISSDGGSPGLPRPWIADTSEIEDIAGRVYDLLNSDMPNQPRKRPNSEIIALAGDLLGGRGDSQADLVRTVSLIEEHCDRLTHEQFRVLDMARRNQRFEVIGGPGTGKTWLAIEQARRWAEDGKRVALVCYSRGLATWIDRQIEGWPRALRQRVRARTFHGLGVEWGVHVADGKGSDYWEIEIPEQIKKMAKGLQAAARFDALVVDEAQDFRAIWWEALLAALHDPETASIAVFGDEHQRIFDRRERLGLHLTPLVLDENLRNTLQIGRVFSPLVDPRPRLLGSDGPPVKFVAATDAGAMDAADDAAVALLDAGWAAKDIAVLSTFHRHIEQISRVEHFGRDGYWKTFWEGEDLFYSTVAGFKGLERPAIVLAIDGFRDPATAREILYVGLSRARDLLVVVADPKTLIRVGGADVAERITRGSSARS